MIVIPILLLVISLVEGYVAYINMQSNILLSIISAVIALAALGVASLITVSIIKEKKRSSAPPQRTPEPFEDDDPVLILKKTINQHHPDNPTILDTDTHHNHVNESFVQEKQQHLNNDTQKTTQDSEEVVKPFEPYVRKKATKQTPKRSLVVLIIYILLVVYAVVVVLSLSTNLFDNIGILDTLVNNVAVYGLLAHLTFVILALITLGFAWWQSNEWLILCTGFLLILSVIFSLNSIIIVGVFELLLACSYYLLVKK